MTTKILTAALAFFTTFSFSSLLMQFAFDQPAPQTSVRWLYSKPANKQVLRFLERDIRNGTQRMSRLSQPEWTYTPPFSRSGLNEYSVAVTDYINRSNNMDDSELPQDLRVAWREHMQAWINYRNFLSDYQNNYWARDFEETNVEILHDEKTAEISRTWYKVLRIAGDNYGAYPANAF